MLMMILETKLIFTCSALIVPLDENVLNIKEHCYGINSRLILKVSRPLIGLSWELKLYLQNFDLDYRIVRQIFSSMMV